MTRRATRSLVILGTQAESGKTLLALAFCRWLSRQGYSVAPFKALNVAIVPYATEDGGAISVAQAQQALAAGLKPLGDMNPITIIPVAGEYVMQTFAGATGHLEILRGSHDTDALRKIIIASYERLCARFDCLIIEGCGSPVEMNVKDKDLTNTWLAEATDSPCLLVADIERGGVFASILGTLDLMEAEERERIIGFVVNKLHGSIAELEHGVRFLEERSGLPCAGVIPYLPNLRFPNEDTIHLPEFRVEEATAKKVPASVSTERDPGAGADGLNVDGLDVDGLDADGSGELFQLSRDHLAQTDRWTDHVMAHFDKDFLAQLADASSTAPTARRSAVS